MGCYSGNPQDTRLIDFDDIFGSKWTILQCFCTAHCLTPTFNPISFEFCFCNSKQAVLCFYFLFFWLSVPVNLKQTAAATEGNVK